MIYIYLYPVDGFERNITDENLIKAYLDERDIERYTPEEFLNAINDDAINLDTHWGKAIDDNAGFYSIASVHIDDLKRSGFDVSKVTESDMMTLADKLNDNYLDWYFWESLQIMAEHIGIPRLNEEKN